MTRVPIPFAVAAVLMVVTHAAADESPASTPSGRHLSLELHGAYPTGSPVGLFGATAHYRVLQNLYLGGGAGMGWEGLQLTASARGHFPLTAGWAIVFEAGASGGRFQPIKPFADGGDRRQWDPAYWANGLIGIEVPANEGFVVRPYLGGSFLLNPSGSRMVDSQTGKEVPATRQRPATVHWLLPVVGCALGVTF